MKEKKTDFENDEKTIETRINEMNELARTIKDFDEVKSLKMSQEAYSLSTSGRFKENNFQSGVAYSLSNISEINFLKGESKKSFENGYESFKIFREIKDFYGQSLVLNILGFSHYAMGNYPEALNCFSTSISISREFKFKDLEGTCLGNLASVYGSLGDDEKMLETFEQSVKILTEINDVSQLSVILNNMAVSYKEIGKYKEALDCGFKSLDLFETEGHKVPPAYLLETIGSTYLELENYDQARKYLDQAYGIVKDNGHEYGEAIVLKQMARLHILEHTGSEMKYLQEALSLCIKLEMISEQGELNLLLSEFFEEEGSLIKALFHYKEFHKFDKKLYKNVNKTYILRKQLNEANEELKILRGIIPICSSCKKIRDDEGYWNQIDSYIQKHSEAEFSHGLCPGCVEELYGKETWYNISKENS